MRLAWLLPRFGSSIFGIDDIALGIVGSSLLGGVLGSKGARDANNASAHSVQAQEDFQQMMRRTAYQDTTWDLKMSDLNPMLAYSQGATPGGAGASFTAQNEMAPLGNAAASAGQAAAQAATVENIKAQTEKTKMDEYIASLSAPQIAAQTRLTQASALAAERDVNEMFDIKKDIATSDQFMKRGEAAQYPSMAESKADLAFYQSSLAKFGYGADLAKKQAEARFFMQMMDPKLRQAAAEATLLESEVPGARASMKRDESWYGQHVRPYLHDGASSASTLFRLRRLFGE